MHIEVQIALNFVISYLYNKLPRRRVNIFGEELEKALKEKFRGHWYPEKPVKGSAFRCLKTGDPVDAVFERAAKESGVPIQDILENLPQDLAVWVDPGEVSYRIGEKGIIKILYVETNDVHEEANADREVIKTFNPEAQCFRPIDAVLGALNLSPKGSPPLPSDVSPTATFKGPGSPSPVAPATTFMPRTTQPLTFTTATFAQTKFGSTKLKTNSKRANRMSPTEFSNYIKQRAMQQQAGGHSHSGQGGSPGRSLSPSVNQQDYLYPSYYRPTSLFDNYHNGDMYQKMPYLEPSQYYPVPPNTPPAPQQNQSQENKTQQLLDSLSNFPTYSPNQYPQLLVAN
ncbi:protein Tob1-like [Cimex lectularius]|uniref:Anti-proliferative protein domain-containing protein n=1 Tax=Cimex lectularius TaxID=79782 RepID=A0A8I6TCK8_CIMLE|nr:protein Tob1-like [Cimex lectularius]